MVSCDRSSQGRLGSNLCITRRCRDHLGCDRPFRRVHHPAPITGGSEGTCGSCSRGVALFARSFGTARRANERSSALGLNPGRRNASVLLGVATSSEGFTVRSGLDPVGRQELRYRGYNVVGWWGDDGTTSRPDENAGGATKRWGSVGWKRPAVEGPDSKVQRGGLSSPTGPPSRSLVDSRRHAAGRKNKRAEA